MIAEQPTNQFGWEFLYMDADQDSVEVGRHLGVKAEQAVTYGRGKSREATAAMSGNVRGYRNAKLGNIDAVMPAFSEDQRSEPPMTNPSIDTRIRRKGSRPRASRGSAYFSTTINDSSFARRSSPSHCALPSY